MCGSSISQKVSILPHWFESVVFVKANSLKLGRWPFQIRTMYRENEHFVSRRQGELAGKLSSKRASGLGLLGHESRPAFKVPVNQWGSHGLLFEAVCRVSALGLRFTN